jgi:hypothetical protein
MTMRMGNGHGRWLAWAAIGALACIPAAPARAGGGLYAWLTGHHTIPRETLAQDYRTGDVYYAPPIPYGHYTKDHAGAVHAAAGLAHGAIAKICGGCQGLGCGLCGGKGMHQGDACGKCGGLGHGHGGDPCGGCGGSGIHSGLGSHLAGKFGGHGGKGGHGLLGGLGHKHNHHGAAVMASAQMAPSPQAMPSAQAIACDPCGGKGHILGKLCGPCGGLGKLGLCGPCGGKGRLGHGDPCGGCGGSGKHGLCGGCGGSGHGHDGGKCGHCGGLGKLHAMKGAAHGLATHLGYKLGHGGVEYFVGPGGPVPITPGYVPYINPVRSPRDFFAFPPFSENAGVGSMDP